MRSREQVVALLRAGGVIEMGDVLNVASASFTFDFVMWSSRSGFNLVVGATPRPDLSRRLLALARALDYIGSKASITLVVGADGLDLRTRADVSRVARVLLVRPESLEDDLRVLLPLHLERKAVASVDPIAILRNAVAGDPLVADSPLLHGYASEQRVRDTLRALVAEELIEQ